MGCLQLLVPGLERGCVEVDRDGRLGVLGETTEDQGLLDVVRLEAELGNM